MELKVKKNMLPSFYGIFEIKHYIDGRIRVYVPSLKKNYAEKNKLVTKLMSLNGINKIRVNVLTGTITVEFDKNIIDVQLLIGVLINLLELEDEVMRKKPGKISTSLKGTLDVVDMAIYNKTQGILDLKSVIALFFIGYGLKKVKQNPILPNGINLLWWAYGLVSKGGN